MALNIKNDEVDRLARELAKATGESITDAVLTAISERLERTLRGHASERKMAEVDELVALAVSLRRHKHGADSDFLYGQDGLPA